VLPYLVAIAGVLVATIITRSVPVLHKNASTAIYFLVVMLVQLQVWHAAGIALGRPVSGDVGTVHHPARVLDYHGVVGDVVRLVIFVVVAVPQ
jgi:hypothetical protein